MAMLVSPPSVAKEHQHDACAPKKGIPPPSKPVSFAQQIKNCCRLQPIFGTASFTIQPHLQADLETCLP